MATTNLVMALAGLAILGALLVEVRELRKAVLELRVPRSARRRREKRAWVEDEAELEDAPSERRTVLPPGLRR